VCAVSDDLGERWEMSLKAGAKHDYDRLTDGSCMYLGMMSIKKMVGDGGEKYLSSSFIIARTRPSLQGAAGIAAEGGTVVVADVGTVAAVVAVAAGIVVVAAVAASIAAAVVASAAAVAHMGKAGRRNIAVWESGVHRRTAS